MHRKGLLSAKSGHSIINGITFKLTETEPEEYSGVCLNPSQIPPDDLDDVLLGRMIKEAGMFYKMELDRRY